MLNNASRIANNRQIIKNNEYGIVNNEQEWDMVVKVKNSKKRVVNALERGKRATELALKRRKSDLDVWVYRRF